MRSRSLAPWDVAVRLVPMQHRAATADAATERKVHRVHPGIPLPGIASVRVTTRTMARRVGSFEAVERIDPEPVESAPGAHPTDLLDLLRGPDGTVPVLVAGTPFSRAVLEALLEVPAGARCTYAGLAARVGRPRAVRAVASVMARNRVPLLLPCHRVVPSTGGTGRYGWGDAVKVALLDAEGPPAGPAGPAGGG